MVLAIAMPRRRGTAAELRRDLMHLAERPMAAAIVEFQDRARIHRQALGGGIGARIEPAQLRWTAAPRRGHWMMTPRGNRPSARSRLALPLTAERGRCRRAAIWLAECVGHRLISSRVSASVQVGTLMTSL
jgi:hypothetical protein